MRKRVPESKKPPKITMGMEVECLTDFVDGKRAWHPGKVERKVPKRSSAKEDLIKVHLQAGSHVLRRVSDFGFNWRLPRRRSKLDARCRRCRKPALLGHTTCAQHKAEKDEALRQRYTKGDPAAKAAPKIPKVVPGMKFWLPDAERWQLKTWRLPQKAKPALAEPPPAAPAPRMPSPGDHIELRFFDTANQVERWREATVTTPPNGAGFFRAEWRDSPSRPARLSFRRVGGVGWRWPAASPESKPQLEQIRTFVDDQRSRPGLHNLHVRWAFALLKDVQQFLSILEGSSQIAAMPMALALRQAMQKEIESNAAFFEAAALIFAGLRPPKVV